MNNKAEEAPLRVRLRGDSVKEGRILLSDLIAFGRQLQTAVNRVAQVLAGETASARPGRRPENLRSACALEVVALSHGSFELALDFHRDQPSLPGMDMGEMAVEKLLTGISDLVGRDEALPSGYDLGVLAAWREAAKVFDHGVDGVEFYFRSTQTRLDVTFDPSVHHRIVERIQGPVRNRRTVEGRLLMADFKDAAPRCRIHPPLGPAIECTFDQEMEETVYDNLRSFVRVTGEAEEDAETGRVRRLRIADIQPTAQEPALAGIAGEDFWGGKTLDMLQAEQDLEGPQPLANLVGAGAELWQDDREFEEFVDAIYERRRESRESEGSRP